jgi:hypothetical protein
MNLQDLNSGTPATKQWLNIVAGSVTTGKLNTTSPNTDVLVTPATITAAQLNNGIIYVSRGADTVLNFPTATELKTYFGGNPDNGLVFSTDIYINTTINVLTMNLGAGTATAGGSTSLLMGRSASPSGYFSANIKYQWLNNDWSVYTNPLLDV